MAMEPQRLMRLATVASTSVALTLVGAKAVAWVVTDSVSMLSSLVDTSLDLVGSLVTFFAVRLALTPADADHRFGHGKAEALAGLVQAGFIAASGCALLFAVAERFNAPKQVREEDVGLMISALALVLTIGLVTFQRYVVRHTGSIAIGADVAHYGTDLVATLVTGIGLFLSGLLDQPLIDSSVAGFVALYLLHGSWKVGRDSLDILMDRELPEEDRRRIDEIARQNPGVKGIHELRTRSGGLTRFIQLHIEVDRNLSLLSGHEIGRRVQGEIAKAFPGAEIILHVDPSPAS
ncbi:cation diffusion facilitator family transporter [Reyranella sp.]|uniref:cation diffusion facilitator family transporter n=1 Tax=Reyranella sp. TaxID=1929291 RepID=UPI0011F4C28E|nr:cation diffusion facilitator family transporter [Reyranella sp.]TAJ85108.1 MAG: cation diffusion facilitator family transporter [Reyranella sp.]